LLPDNLFDVKLPYIYAIKYTAKVDKKDSKEQNGTSSLAIKYRILKKDRSELRFAKLFVLCQGV